MLSNNEEHFKKALVGVLFVKGACVVKGVCLLKWGLSNKRGLSSKGCCLIRRSIKKKNSCRGAFSMGLVE